MDALAGLLDGPRAREAFLLRALMDPPWAIRVQDEAPLTVIAMVRGDAHVRFDDEGAAAAVRVPEGAVVVVRGPEPYVFGDAPDTPHQIVVHPGDRCTTLDGTDLAEPMSLGVRTWGTSASGATQMLVGTYHLDGEIGRRLLDALPRLVVVEPEELASPLVPLLGGEVAREAPGQEAVLDRLLDLLLIAVLRAWFARPEAGVPAWVRAHEDPVVGHALRLLHHAPDAPWTVAKLAHEVGVSRAALARRFTELVGEPPMAFLTGWRLTLAADLLREPGATIGSVAAQVGYGSPFALSTAFKRHHGVSPQDYRAGGPSAAEASAPAAPPPAAAAAAAARAS